MSPPMGQTALNRNSRTAEHVSVNMSEQSVGAHSLNGSQRPSRAFKAGRVCRYPGCGTVLSIYNDGKFCYTHEPMVVPRMRGKKIA